MPLAPTAPNCYKIYFRLRFDSAYAIDTYES